MRPGPAPPSPPRPFQNVISIFPWVGDRSENPGPLVDPVVPPFAVPAPIPPPPFFMPPRRHLRRAVGSRRGLCYEEWGGRRGAEGAAISHPIAPDSPCERAPGWPGGGPKHWGNQGGGPGVTGEESTPPHQRCGKGGQYRVGRITNLKHFSAVPQRSQLRCGSLANRDRVLGADRNGVGSHRATERATAPSPRPHTPTARAPPSRPSVPPGSGIETAEGGAGHHGNGHTPREWPPGILNVRGRVEFRTQGVHRSISASVKYFFGGIIYGNQSNKKEDPGIFFSTTSKEFDSVQSQSSTQNLRCG